MEKTSTIIKVSMAGTTNCQILKFGFSINVWFGALTFAQYNFGCS